MTFGLRVLDIKIDILYKMLYHSLGRDFYRRNSSN